MFKSVDHHNPKLELTIGKRKVSELISFYLRKPNSHSIQSNPRYSAVSCVWQDVADSRVISKCGDHYWKHHNFTTCRPFSQPFLLGLWQAVCYLNSKFASIAKIWKLLATESRNQVTKSRGQLLIKQQLETPLLLEKTGKGERLTLSYLKGYRRIKFCQKNWSFNTRMYFIKYFCSAKLYTDYNIRLMRKLYFIKRLCRRHNVGNYVEIILKKEGKKKVLIKAK